MYTHTYMPLHFINASKPLDFGYETCPRDLINTIKCALKCTYTECPTRYGTRHFFNNYNTNEDIATKFEQHML